MASIKKEKQPTLNQENPSMNKDFVLFCAGEDSGDILGAEAVSAINLWGVEAIGIGGPRMQKEGLKAIGHFDDFAISGFKDVLTHYSQLSRYLKLLKKTLENPHCVALVLIDYPGFNMRLVEYCKNLSKPILYIAPPQIWAWKSKRAYRLQNVTLGVLYDYEQEAYKRFGCESLKIENPFLKGAISLVEKKASKENTFLFLPGSRHHQLHRNMTLFIKIAKDLHRRNPELQIKFVVSRNSLINEIKKWNIEFEQIMVPENSTERAVLFSKAQGVVATPGSGILEVSLVGTRALACARIDPLTYFLGKLLVKTKFFTLPNLLLLKRIVPEYLSPVSFFYKKEVSSIVEELQKTEKEDYSSQASALQKKCEGTPIKCLALEFLMDVLNRDSEQGRLSIRRN